MPIKVFIDQGHNPVNPNAGAEGNGYREQDLTYVIGQELATLLAANPNFEVKLSRNSETEQLGTSIATSLAARVNAATEWGADLFLSLHANASESAAPSGSEAFVYRMSSTAYYIAEQLLRGLHESTGLPTRGVFVRPGLYVLRKTPMPAVLVEIGFISNPQDASLMANQPGLFAEGLYQGLLSYYGF